MEWLTRLSEWLISRTNYFLVSKRGKGAGEQYEEDHIHRMGKKKKKKDSTKKVVYRTERMVGLLGIGTSGMKCDEVHKCGGTKHELFLGGVTRKRKWRVRLGYRMKHAKIDIRKNYAPPIGMPFFFRAVFFY